MRGSRLSLRPRRLQRREALARRAGTFKQMLPTAHIPQPAGIGPSARHFPGPSEKFGLDSVVVARSGSGGTLSPRAAPKRGARRGSHLGFGRGSCEAAARLALTAPAARVSAVASLRPGCPTDFRGLRARETRIPRCGRRRGTRTRPRTRTRLPRFQSPRITARGTRGGATRSRAVPVAIRPAPEARGTRSPSPRARASRSARRREACRDRRRASAKISRPLAAARSAATPSRGPTAQAKTFSRDRTRDAFVQARPDGPAPPLQSRRRARETRATLRPRALHHALALGAAVALPFCPCVPAAPVPCR